MENNEISVSTITHEFTKEGKVIFSMIRKMPCPALITPVVGEYLKFDGIAYIINAIRYEFAKPKDFNPYSDRRELKYIVELS